MPLVFSDAGDDIRLPEDYNVTFLGTRNQADSNFLRNTFEKSKLSFEKIKNLERQFLG